MVQLKWLTKNTNQLKHCFPNMSLPVIRQIYYTLIVDLIKIIL